MYTFIGYYYSTIVPVLLEFLEQGDRLDYYKLHQSMRKNVNNFAYRNNKNVLLKCPVYVEHC